MQLETCLALSLVRGASWSRVAALLREATERAPQGETDDLASRVVASAGLGPDALAEARCAATRVLARATRLGLEAVPLGDPRFPPLLAAIYDPPPVLWVRGDARPLLGPAVALVGARAASATALSVAAELARGLARAGLVVVSGLARGVDSAAHAATLDSGASTVAVLGCGVDRVYPPEHGDLAQAVAAQGALVSDLPPGTPPLKEHFPRRNRLISGLSLATVVVEASEHSGSLITARCALEQGREVMAVPGPTPGGRNRGAHALLKDGAKLVETADDILEGLPGFSVSGPAVQRECNLLTGNRLVDTLRADGPCDLDRLSLSSGLDARSLLRELLDLELRGLVERAGGGRFRAASTRVVR